MGKSGRKGTVLVTGGTCRIGKAIADTLRDAGWNMLTSSHRKDSGADFIQDLSDPFGPVKLYSAVLAVAPDDFCAIVNNAALFRGDPAMLEAVNLPVRHCRLAALRQRTWHLRFFISLGRNP